MCSQKEFKILIIDSLAGIVRYEYDIHQQHQMNERTYYLFSLANQLKRLSETYNLAVVVVNQVSADMQLSSSSSSSNNNNNNNREFNPALGLTWSHCINTRFIVQKPLGSSSYRINVSENEESNSYNDNSYSSSTSERGRQENKENEENSYHPTTITTTTTTTTAERNPKRKLSEVFSSPPLPPLPGNRSRNSNHNNTNNNNNNQVIRRQVRSLKLEFSSLQPSKQVSFEICSNGLVSSS
jgi:hypothetical protein